MKKRAPRNRTVRLTDNEIELYAGRGITLDRKTGTDEILNKTIYQDFADAVKFLPVKFADLLILDPPYNIDKRFEGTKFRKLSIESYTGWFESFFPLALKLLKEDASIYICSDWFTSVPVYNVISKYVNVRNRITWEREKGRGSKRNWKNNTEDIWFCTMSDDYAFDIDSVMMKKKVIAPYRNESGEPKDWRDEEEGRYRLTHPSNIWTDISVPFWSMKENTDHPTQKPEKLIAKLILSSSLENDIILDPFLGSGTTSVVAKKLKRRYVGIERERLYVALAEKRLAAADTDNTIQGYFDGLFWERNSLSDRKKRQERN